MTTTILISLSVRYWLSTLLQLKSTKLKQRQSTQKQPKRDPLDVFGDSDENEPNQVAPAAPPSSTPSSLPPPTIKKETIKEEVKVEKKKETKFVDEVTVDKDEPKEQRVFDF